ncbi:MAG: recombinase family protein [bacterium]
MTTRTIATYERVSTVDQRERETILTQYGELQRRIGLQEDVEVVERYVDDGITGMLDLDERPAGARLLDDARSGKFDELWIYKVDRLGRDGIDPLIVRRDLERVGVKVVSISESVEDPLMYGILVAFAAHERRTFMKRSRDGMERAAREGRYTGGIIAFGLDVPGRKQNAHYVIDEAPFWEGMSPAGLIRWMYELLAVEKWSPERIAVYWNSLGVPTAYWKDGREVLRGKRKEKTDGTWRGPRIRELAIQPIYKGTTTYGKHPPKRRDGTKPVREVIFGRCVAIVSEELWEAAQVAIRSRRKCNPDAAHAKHLLRSLIRCAHCGLNYSGGLSRGRSWYKCNGRMKSYVRYHGLCPSAGIDGSVIEPMIQRDICAFLLFPGDVLEDLVVEMADEPSKAVGETERLIVQSKLLSLGAQKKRTLRLATVSEDVSDAEIVSMLADLEQDRVALERRLVELTPDERPTKSHRSAVPDDLLAQLRDKVEEGFSEEQWIDLFTLLVKRVTAHTEEIEGKQHLRLVVEYNFGANVSCGETDDTDMDCSFHTE